jgi:hypothetical protein
MTEAAEDSLAELMAREQRGFRRILFAGLAAILVMGLMSAALGVYLYAASRSLAQTTRTLQHQAFDTRRAVDAQTNRVAAQENTMRRIFEDVRRASGEGALVVGPQTLPAALEAARDYLLLGRAPSLSNERLIGAVSESASSSIPPSAKALMKGVAALVEFESRGEQIAADATALPERLSNAVLAFETARNDPAYASLANAGIAWVRFQDAGSGRNNYSAASCKDVFSQVDATVQEGFPSPQPLYWRAQCERKLGMTRESLVDYAHALRDSVSVATKGQARDAAEQTLAMNAFHGVGTTLIAAKDIADSDPGMAEALSTAQQNCPAEERYASRSPRMALALACLDQAIALRRALKQTPNQISGTAENISFAHLRDGDFNAAFEHASAVERTGLFAWTEVVRALSASHAHYDDPAKNRAAAAAAIDARRNVSFFNVGQFNICELEALLNSDQYAEVIHIIATEHSAERDKVRCVSQTPS